MSGSTIYGNNGLIEVGAGSAPIVFPGPVVGTGTLVIDPGGVIESSYSIAPGISLEFNPGISPLFGVDALGGGGIALLGDPAEFLGTIYGFGPGDQLVIQPPAGQTIASAVISGNTLELLSPGGTVVEALAFAASNIPAADSLTVVPVSSLNGFNIGTIVANEVVVGVTGPAPTLVTTPVVRVTGSGSTTTIPQVTAYDPGAALSGAQFTLTLSSTTGTFSEEVSLPAYVAGLTTNNVVLNAGDGSFDAGAVRINGTTVALGGYAAGSTLSVAGSGSSTLILTSDNINLLNLQAALITYTAAASGNITTTFSDGTATLNSTTAVQSTGGPTNFAWQNLSGGNFSTAANWGGAGGTIVPGAADNLSFGTGNYSVTGDGAAATVNVTGNPSFQGAINISNPGSTALTVQGGGNAGFTGVLVAQGNVVTGGSSSGQLNLFGPITGINGNLTIGAGANGVLQTDGLVDVTGNILVGVGGSGTVNEFAAGNNQTSFFSRSGSEIIAANITIGVGAGQPANFSDTSASLAATGVIAIAPGAGSRGTLSLISGTVSAPSIIIGSGGTLINSAGASTVTVSSSLLNQGTLESLGGSLVVNGTVDNRGVILAQGGSIALSSVTAGSGTGTLVAGSGGVLDLGSIDATQTIDLLQGSTLYLDQVLPTGSSAGTAPTDRFAPTINMLGSSSTILVGSPGSNVVVTSETYSAGTLDIAFTEAGGTQFGTLALVVTGLGPAASFSSSGTNGVILPCFATGTRIDTDRGEVAVEHLKVGDVTATASGGKRRIVWIGHREVDCQRHAQAERVHPVRISRGAFGEGVPWRDLYLSPDHSVFVDNVLIPIQYLVNGRTIVQVPVARVGYWHVELEQHDILLAEGLPVESYLDTGNRSNFANGGDHVQLHPDFAPLTWSDACAELVVEGPIVIAVKRRLFALAGREQVRPRGELEVLVGRRHLVPEILGPGVWRCTLPRGARRVVLASPTWMPAAHAADSLDQRRLGVMLCGLTADGVEVALDSSSLVRGFHPIEERAEGMFRWTMGEAEWLVPAGTRTITLYLADDPAVSSRSAARRSVA